MNSNIENTVQKPPRATAALILSIISIAVGILFLIFDLIGIAFWHTEFPDSVDKAMGMMPYVQMFTYFISIPIGIIAVIYAIKAKKLAVKNPEKYAYPNAKKTHALAITGLILQCVTLTMFIILLIIA